MTMRARATQCMLAVVAAAALTACGAYRLGHGAPAVRGVEVRPVRNAAPLAGVHATIHQALVSALSEDTRLRVRAGGDPLETEVIGIERGVVARSPNDALVAGQMKVTLTIRCTLGSAEGKGARFTSRQFQASAVLPVNDGLAGEERSVLPRLAAELAAQVRDAVAGAW